MAGNYNEHPWRVTRRGEPTAPFHGLTMPQVDEAILQMLQRHGTALDAASGANITTTTTVPNASPNLQSGNITLQSLQQAYIQATEGEWFRPFFKQLATTGGQNISGGQQMRTPIQFWHGRPSAVSLDGQEMEVVPQSRENDLQRRLDFVRDTLLRFFQQEVQRADSPSQVWYSVPGYRITLADLEDVVDALTYEPRDPGYTYKYRFVNEAGRESDLLVVGEEKIGKGTILDAAARPVRKFRLVQE